MVASEIAYDRVSGHDGILTIANQINLAMIVGNTMQPFHLAVPVRDVAIARQFYKEVIGCTEGRSDTRWVDFDLFGHQFVIHQKDDLQVENSTNPVDGHDVPIPHFGVVLDWEKWHEFADRLQEHQIEFVIEPGICLLYTSPSPRDRG